MSADYHLQRSRRDEARAARAVVERALAGAGGPWSRRLSLWLDALVILEEAT